MAHGFPVEGLYVTKITVSITANNSINDIDRSVTLTLTSTDKDYKRSGYITVTVKQSGATSPPSDKFNGHEYVELGLPSGLLWATCNVGASKPEEYGNYYAWGETSTKSEYSYPTSTTFGETKTQLKSSGIIGSDGNLTASYDVAHKDWGGTWRMPTLDEIEELINNTTTERTTLNGVYGRKVTSKKNGNSIFLPDAGHRDGTSLYSAGSNGYYWSSSPSADNIRYACELYFYSSFFDYNTTRYRFTGQSVRPVSEP